MNIEPGSRVSMELEPWVMGKEDVHTYLQAVQVPLPIYEETDAVPATAIVARVLREVLDRVGLPPGALHASQDMETLKAVKAGEELSCHLTLSRPADRRGLGFLAVEFLVKDQGGDGVLRGKTLVLVPSVQRRTT